MRSHVLPFPPEALEIAVARRRFRIGRHSAWLLALAFFLAFLLGATTLPLTDVDEGAFTEATREMLAADNLVSPTLNGHPRHDKPILIYWAQAASVSILGINELGFRLPSLIAAVLWVLATGLFCARFGRRADAPVAMLVMTLSLMVGLIAKAAIADALLNLWLALSMFGVYAYSEAGLRGDGASARRALRLTALALGLGFLTKGPVALMFPVVVGGLYLLSIRQWRLIRDALCDIPAWLLLMATVLPWHVLVYLDQGDAFFRGFYLQHNVNRYTSTFEGHGGNPLYYLMLLPVVLLPFSGWALVSVRRAWRRLRRAGEMTADVRRLRFLALWFGVVFIFFSLSRTQLPHYLLYGCTPLFLLMARYRPWRQHRWLVLLPGVLGLAAMALLPLLLPELARWLMKADDLALLAALQAALSIPKVAVLVALALVSGLLAGLWHRNLWPVVLVIGLVQAVAFNGLLAPMVMSATQVPVRELAEIARPMVQPVVSYRVSQPSFSVYRQAVTPSRLPELGEIVFTRRDRLAEVVQRVQPAEIRVISERGRFVLAQREASP